MGRQSWTVGPENKSHPGINSRPKRSGLNLCLYDPRCNADRSSASGLLLAFDWSVRLEGEILSPIGKFSFNVGISSG